MDNYNFFDSELLPQEFECDSCKAKMVKHVNRQYFKEINQLWKIPTCPQCSNGHIFPINLRDEFRVKQEEKYSTIQGGNNMKCGDHMLDPVTLDLKLNPVPKEKQRIRQFKWFNSSIDFGEWQILENPDIIEIRPFWSSNQYPTEEIFVLYWEDVERFNLIKGK